MLICSRSASPAPCSSSTSCATSRRTPRKTGLFTAGVARRSRRRRWSVRRHRRPQRFALAWERLAGEAAAAFGAAEAALAGLDRGPLRPALLMRAAYRWKLGVLRQRLAARPAAAAARPRGAGAAGRADAAEPS